VRLILPRSVTERLIAALRKGGKREVGGILMAEHVGPNEFRVADLTVQLQGGTFATFVRFVDSILAPLRAFFTATGRDYTRFNYIGEWHSHHSFQLSPSRRDDATMLEIVTDPSVGARFAVLLIVRLDERGDGLQHSLSVYLPTGHRFTGQVASE
jgi:hypothetical protein